MPNLPTTNATKAIACNASYGSGGLGQHFTQIIEAARQQNTLVRYYSSGIQPNDPAGQLITVPILNSLPYTPLRYSPGWINYLGGELFDRAVAAHLTSTEAFEGFGGQSLHCFRRARQLGCEVLHLQAANSHVNHVMRQHSKALQRFGIESTWLNQTQCQKTLREYQLADIIHVASEYTRQTFLAEGFPAENLQRLELTVHPRFIPPVKRPDDGVLRIVYVGSLTVMKGIPILLEAFSRLPGTDVQLTLVGGWATRGMRRYLQTWLARDSRIQIAPGDPLPHLQRASVYVHPTYEDGFAYAPMEALACGVPAIVTEDTGMKEYIQPGVNGYVIPTGDWEALLEKLETYKLSPFTQSSR
ncbi:MAG: glycosyltransferase family 4 protein [Leptolyngbya sp. BL-A-14]